MTTRHDPLGAVTDLAAALRDEFDRSFAEPHRQAALAPDGYIVVPIEGQSYLLRLAELSGLVADRRIVAVPARVPHLLGVAGIRGAVTAVYDLAGMLGHRAARSAPRWLAIASGQRVGLAFEHLAGHVQVAHGSLIAAPPESRAHIRGAVRLDDILHRIVDLPGVVGTIERLVGAATSKLVDADVDPHSDPRG